MRLGSHRRPADRGLGVRLIQHLGAVGVLTVAALSIVVSPPAGATQGQTVSAGTGVDGESYWTVVVTPGKATQVQLSVKVDNPTKIPQNLELSPVDSLQSPEGGEAYGTTDVGPARWVTGLPSSVTLAARQSEMVPFTVSVPATAVVGDHLAGISVSSVPAATPNGGAVATIDNRVVVGLAVEVGKGMPAMKIHWAKSPTQGRVVVSLSNPGTTWLHPKGSISAEGHQWATEAETVLPKGTVHLVASTPGLTAGQHHISVVLSSTGVTATWNGEVLVGSDSAATPLTPTGTHALPGSAAATYLTDVKIAAPVVIGAILVLMLLRRQKRQKRSLAV